MGRLLRPHMPGMPFHITARTQGGEPLFEGIEDRVVVLVRDSIRYSDAELVAYAVMRNHIHVIVVQGRRPLGEFMQPLLRRVALLVGRRTGRRGHVFHGRYAHRVCQDPEYFRSMIAYVHMNPVRAGLCRTADRYEFSSHRDYARGPGPGCSARYALAIEQAVRVFAGRSAQSYARCRRDYSTFMRWRQAMDRYLSAEADGACRPMPRMPLSIGGDLHWHREYGSVSPARIAGIDNPLTRPLDLRDHVLIELKDLDPELPLDLLRSGSSTKPLVRVRSRVIARALSAGYTGRSVADFLNISPAAVSRVKSMLRDGAAL